MPGLRPCRHTSTSTLGPEVVPFLHPLHLPSGVSPSPPFLAQGGDRHLRGCQLSPHLGLGPPSYFLPILSTGDSWGMLACLCTVLWHLPAVPALNRTGDPGPGPSIQKTYDLTRYLEHQLRSLAGTYVSIPFTLGRGFGAGGEHGAGVLVSNGVMREALWVHTVSPSGLSPALPSQVPPHPGPGTRHVGRPRTRLGPLPHWLPAQLPASPGGWGSLLCLHRVVVSLARAGLGGDGGAPPSVLVFQLDSTPRPGALLLQTRGPPSVCLSHPSQAS